MNIAVVIMMILCITYGISKVKNYSIIVYKYKFTGEIIFLFCACIILWFFAAFRGDFTKDYFTYYWGFNNNINISYIDILKNDRDFLFWIVTKPFSMITTNALGAFVFITGVTMLCYYKVIKNESVDYYLTLILFVSIDNYVVSFNLMRNCLAVALCAWAFQFIWERKIWRYILVIIVAAMIHRSALIMLPMYWVLQIDFRKKKYFILLIISFFLMWIGMTYTKNIALWGQQIIGMDYLSYDDYGLDEGTLGSALKTIGLFAIIIVLFYKIEFNNVKERILFNSAAICCYLQILASQVLMMQRIAYYFSFSYILLLPLLISRINDKRIRILIKISFILFLFIYVGFIQNTTEYYFEWNNIKCRY